MKSSIGLLIVLASLVVGCDEASIPTDSSTVLNSIEAPKGLTVVANSENELTLSWQALSADVIGYQIEGCWGGEAGFVPLAQTKEGATSFVWQGTGPSTIYQARVLAITGSGLGEPSEPVTCIRTKSLYSKMLGSEFRSPSCVAYSPDGNELVYCDLDLVWVDAMTGGELGYRSFAPASAVIAAFLQDGSKTLVGLSDGSMRLVPNNGGGAEQILLTGGETIYQVVPLDDGRRVVYGRADGEVCVLDIYSGRSRVLVEGNGEPFGIVGMTIQAAGNLIGVYENTEFGASKGRLTVYDAGSLKLVKTMYGVYNFALNGNGTRVVIDAYRVGAKIYDTGNWGQIQTLYGGDVYAFSPDGKYIVTGWKELKCYEVETGKAVPLSLTGVVSALEAEQFGQKVLDLRFSRDGRFLSILHVDRSYDVSYLTTII